MTIYTSYFAALRRIPDHVIPVSICLKAPYWFKGIQYKLLAPSSDIFLQYKANPDECTYKSRFNNEILGALNQGHIMKELECLSNGNDVVLLCYEKATSFCHRHLVAAWLNEFLDNKVTEWA